MDLEMLNKLHQGHVLERSPNKERIRVCRSDHNCEMCGVELDLNKCVRYEKGAVYLFWECFSCYLKSRDILKEDNL